MILTPHTAASAFIACSVLRRADSVRSMSSAVCTADTIMPARHQVHALVDHAETQRLRRLRRAPAARAQRQRMPAPE